MVDTAVRFEQPPSLAVELLEPELADTDELIEAEMRRQCLQIGTRRPSDEVSRPSEVTLSLEVRLVEGESPVLSAGSVVIVVEAENTLHVLGTTFSDAVDGIVGMRVDETREIPSVFPLNHPAPLLRGAPALLTVTVQSIASIEPATVDQVVA